MSSTLYRIVKSKFIGMLLCLAVSVVPKTLQADALLYGVTLDDNLITINTATGAGTLVGALNPSMAALGIGSTGGQLFVYDQNNQLLQQVNPTNAATLTSTNLGITNTEEGDLTFRKDGTGFLMSNVDPSGTFTSTATLYSFDRTIPSSTVVTTTTDPLMDGLAFSPGGTLFGLDQAVAPFGGPLVQPALYTIDPTTGVATLVGSTGVSGSFGLGGLAFRSDGALFGTFTSFGASDSNLYRIDPSTGAATFVGSTGFGQLDGLAFLDTTTTAVPEPSTNLLLGTALLFLVAWTRGRKAPKRYHADRQRRLRHTETDSNERAAR